MYYTNRLTPFCRVLLEKLTGLQVVKKFPAFHGTRRFITALTSVRHLSLSWASPIQSIYPHSTSWRSILILSTHLCLGLPSGLLPPVSPARPYTPLYPHPYAPHTQPISFVSILSPAQYWVLSTNHLAPRYAVSSIPPLPAVRTGSLNKAVCAFVCKGLNLALDCNEISFILLEVLTYVCIK